VVRGVGEREHGRLTDAALHDRYRRMLGDMVVDYLTAGAE
jgi:hypothetical protein